MDETKTFIRIGFSLTIDAATIAAYLPEAEIVDDFGDERFDPAIATLNGGVAQAEVRAYLRLTTGEWLCSSLTTRELDHRLRKAGHTIL